MISTFLVARRGRTRSLIPRSSPRLAGHPDAMHPVAGSLRPRRRWTPFGDAGTRKSHVHLVDVDTKQLVCAWLLTAVASPPQVTKEFDVDVVLNQPAHKKVSYDNPWDRKQTYRLRSSNPNVMRPKMDRVPCSNGL